MNQSPIIQLNLKAIICRIKGYHTTATYRGRSYDYIRCTTCGNQFLDHRDKCRFPNFKQIISQCKEKMKSQFPKYGNSWRGERNFQFWKRRLENEIKEIWEAKTEAEFKKEIVDAINILAMINENSSSWEAHVNYYGLDKIQSPNEVEQD